MYQQTSLFAYADAKKKTSKRHEEILKCFTNGVSLNNRQISTLTGLPINCVTPRVQELRKMFQLVEACRMKDDDTGRLSIYWALPTFGKVHYSITPFVSAYKSKKFPHPLETKTSYTIADKLKKFVCDRLELES